MKDYKSEIAAFIAKAVAIQQAGLSETEVYDLIEIPQDEDKGDYAFVCFRLAKALKKAPQLIAEELAAELKEIMRLSPHEVENIGAYVNIYLYRGELARITIEEVLKMEHMYGSHTQEEKRPVIVEFSSPNIAKPFHIGHIRSTVIGNSIEKIYSFCGYNTVRINHLGDYGTQFGKMIVAYRKWGSKADVDAAPIKTLLSYYTKFHEEAEKDPSLEDEAREAFSKLEGGSSEELGLWQWFRDVSLGEFNRVYKMLGIEFDSYAGESFYSDKMGAVLDKLVEKNLLTESDGAQIVDLSAYDMPAALVTKKDGSTLYITRDLAAVAYRKETYNFLKNIYVVASAQNLHFQQVFKIAELMGYDWAEDCIHIPFGLVSLEDGVMSTREGRVVFLEDVLNKAVERTREIMVDKNVVTDNLDKTAAQVGIGAVIFNELSNNRIKDYVFSWNKVLTFDGETGPYVQYTHARAVSVLRKSGDRLNTRIDYSKLQSDSAYRLVKLIYAFPSVTLEACEKYEPSIITRHIINIAQAFNRFYHEEQILTKDEDERKAKLSLVLAAGITLKNGLRLLGMEAPDRM